MMHMLESINPIATNPVYPREAGNPNSPLLIPH